MKPPKREMEFGPPSHDVEWILIDPLTKNSTIAMAQTAFQAYEIANPQRDGLPLGFGQLDICQYEDYLKRQETKKEKAPMNFGQALEVLKNGGKVWRSGWNGKGMWICLQKPDASSKMTLPYIYMKTADDQLVPWLASQTDLLSEDWQTD